MARPTGPSFSHGKDWRARVPADQGPKGGRGLQRALLSALLLTLVVLLVVLLWPRRVPTVHLVCLPVSDYDLTMPPVPYAVQNAEHLLGLQDQGHLKADRWDDLQTSQGLAALSGRLEALGAEARTALIVYVSAHGVADNGAPYLLCSDFQPRRNPDGRVELGEFLRQFRRCRAKPKLLILDVATITTDPRLGMVVNEFARLVESKVRETGDPDLFVLMSQGPLERAHVSHAARRSVFNYYAVEGLRGAANRTDPNDYLVDLAEFYTFVRNGVGARVAQQTDEGETQLPVLFCGDKGIPEEALKEIALVRVPAEKKEQIEEENKDKPSDKDGKAGAEKADKSGKAEEGQGKGAGDDKGGSPAKPDAGSPAASASPKPPAADPKASASAANPSAADPKSAQGAAQPLPSEAPAGDKKPAAEASDKSASAKEAAKPGDAKDAPPATPPKGAEQGAGAAKPGGAQEAPAPEAKPAPPAAAKTDVAAKPAAPDALPSSASGLLARAWQVRDRMQIRNPPLAWSPVDYAPHLWREYQEVLLGFELRVRYGAPLSRERLKALEDLARGNASASASGEASILGRLESARQAFLADTQTLQRFAQARSEGLGDIEEAIKLRNDLWSAAPYYVRWHARAALASSFRPPRIATLLDEEHLPKLTRLLESLEAPGAADRAERAARLAELRKTRQAVEQLRAEIEDGANGPKRIAQEVLASPQKRPADIHKIEGLLCVPLLPAETRARLLERLVQLEPPMAPGTASQEPRAPGSGASLLARWRAYAEQAQLEALLARLADRECGISADALAALSRDAAKEDTLWGEYRKLGRALGEFYRGLPERVGRGYNSPQIAEVQEAARLLRLVDPRDVAGWADKVSAIAVRPPFLPPELRIQFAAPAAVALERENAWVPVDAELKLSGAPCNRASVRIDYDAARLEVVDRDGKQPLGSGQERAMALDAAATDQTALLRLNVRPKAEPAWRESLLTLRATAQDKTAACQIKLEVPLPDVVEVVVERVIDLATRRKVAADTISRRAVGRERPNDVLCDAFPNRTTEYVVSVANRSGQAKKVVVEVWAPPSASGSADQPLLGPLDSAGKPLLGYRKLASSPEVDLDAAGTPRPVPFVPTKAEPAKESAEEAKKPAEKGEKKEAAAADQALVTRGLACVVHDTTKKGATKEPQVWWLKFEPVAPRQYVQPSVEPGQGRITVRVETAQAELLPPLSKETPIRIDWDTAGTIDPDSLSLTQGTIEAPGRTCQLFAEVAPAPGKEVQVRLSVDGYPRAFLRRVATDPPRLIDVERLQRDVRILAPHKGEAFRIPLESPLLLAFQVDAPIDAFRRLSDRPRDVVEVSMDVVGERRFTMQEKLRFFSDRQFEARVREIGGGGLLKIDAKVDDFRVPLDPGQLRNAEVDIRVALLLAAPPEGGTTGADVKSASVRVVFDAARPTIRLIDLPRKPVVKGADAVLTVEVKDVGSGVARLEAGLDVDNSSDLEEKEKLAELLPPNIEERVKLALPTKELKVGKYRIYVRAGDKVGWKTTEPIGFLEVVEPPPKPVEPKMPALSSISGRVEPSSADRRWIGLVVEIEGSADLKPTISPQGEFTINDVPPGQYTLHAKGIWGNLSRSGSAKVTVTEKPATVTIATEPAG